MTNQRWTAVAGVAAILAGVGLFAGFATGTTPEGTDAVREVAAIYSRPGSNLVRDLLLTASAVPLLIFATILRERMRSAGAVVSSSMAGAATVLVIVLLFGWIVPDAALNTSVGRMTGPDTTYAFFLLADESLSAMIIPFAVLVVVTSLATLSGRSPLPRWLGVAGLVAAIPMVLGALSLFMGGGIAQPTLLVAIWVAAMFGLTNLWLAAAGTALVVRSLRPSEATRTQPRAA